MNSEKQYIYTAPSGTEYEIHALNIKDAARALIEHGFVEIDMRRIREIPYKSPQDINPIE